MSYDIRGAFAAAALCATLAACGGSDATPPPPPPPPPPVPATVTIQADVRADAGASEQFATSVTTTTGLSFHWDFGDGASAETAVATHAYAAPGDYQVVVAVSNAAEDIRTATWTIHVGHYAKLAGAACSGDAGTGWCWQNILGSGNTLNDVWFTDASHGWAVGTNATLIKTSDGGATWTSVAVDPGVAGVSLYAVRFVDANNGIITSGGSASGWGAGGTVLRTSDGGATWTPSTIPASIATLGSQVRVQAWDGDTVLLSDGASQVVSHDGGATWSAGAPGYSPTVENGGDCWAVNYQSIDAFAGCGNARTGGVAINQLPVATGMYFLTPQGLSFGSSTQAVAIATAYSGSGYQDILLTTSDRGATWNTAFATGLPPNSSLSNLSMADATHGWVIAPNACCAPAASPFYATADGGLTWSQVPLPAGLPATPYYYPTTGLQGHAYWIAQGNTIAVTADYGATWQAGTLTAEAGNVVSLVHWFDANDFVVTPQSGSGRFYATHDGGQTWSRILGPDPRDVNAASAAISFADATHGAFVTSRGELLATADGGATWKRQDYATNSNQPVSLQFVSATEAWMQVSGRLAHSTDSGASWVTPLLQARLGSGLAGVQWLDATHAWAWGYDASTNVCYLTSTTDAGATWTDATVPGGTCLGSAVFSDATHGTVQSNYYAVPYFTTDGGRTWAISTQASSLGLNGKLQAGGGAGDVWLIGNVLAHSTDGGKTWTIATDVTGPVNAVHFADANHGWAVGNGGQLLATVDGGRTWTSQNSGTTQSLVAVGSSDKVTAWVVTTNGEVLATATGGF